MQSGTTRRNAIGRLTGVILAPWAVHWTTGLAAEDDAGLWSSKEIRLERRGDLSKSPIVSAVALRPGGQHVALAGDDHLIRIWDLGQHRQVFALRGHSDWVRGLDFSMDGRLLASAGSDGRVIVWDANVGSKLREHTGERPLAQVAFDLHAERLISIGFRNEMRVVEVASGRSLAALGCPCVDMRALAIAPDNRHLAAGGRNGRIRVWDLDSSEILTEFEAHRQRLRALDFAPGGDRLVSCGEDRAVRIWHLDGRLDYELPVSGGKVMALAFCGSFELATGGSDNVVRIWDLRAREEVARLSGHTGSVVALAGTEEILVSSAFDSTVRVWRRTRNVAEDRQERPDQLGGRPASDTVAR